MKPSILGNIADFTIGNAITIPITKYNSSYSDTLNIYVGSTWIKRVEGLTNNKSVSFTTTEINNIYKAMPNVSSASFRFVNTTYNGANVVGTSEKVAAGSIKESIKPTISSVSLTEAISAITTKFGGYVQYQSRITCNVTASAGTGSSIYSYNGNIGTFVVMDNPITTNQLTVSGTNNYSITVTDKRNRVSEPKTGTFNVLAYDNPKITTFSVVRCDSNGTENLYGSYVKVNASAEISSVNNKNDKSFKIQYKLRSATAWTDLLTYNSGYTYTVTNSVHSGFSVDNVYDFRIVVTDFFTSIERELNISAGFAIIDLKGNGKGIALGKVSTKDALEIGFSMYDKYDTLIGNGLSVYRTNGVAVNPDETLEDLVLTEVNTPEGGGFWYVRTMFYASKTVTSNRTQVAYPYNKVTSSPYYRIYFNGGWSDWKSFASIIGASDYEGVFKSGKQVIETGWVTITPTANIPTPLRVNFSNTYKYIPVVLVSASSGVIGTLVTGCSTNGIDKTGANIVVTRTNTVPTSVYYVVIGEVV